MIFLSTKTQILWDLTYESLSNIFEDSQVRRLRSFEDLNTIFIKDRSKIPIRVLENLRNIFRKSCWDLRKVSKDFKWRYPGKLIKKKLWFLTGFRLVWVPIFHIFDRCDFWRVFKFLTCQKSHLSKIS